jgi:ectoine hydroxylase-related dioxygenase (phytanoyl-CoA dioxygenase family)
MAFRRLFAEQELKLSSLPSFRAEHFPYSGPYPWLDLPDAEEQIALRLREGTLTEEAAALCRYWSANGYVIVRNLIEHEALDDVWRNYEKAVAAGKIKLLPEKAAEDDAYPGRFLNPHKKVGAFCRILKHAELLRTIRLLMEREPRPLQTIAAHKGSQQGLHSDSIHMTTYPLGYLTAAWIAFEDIDPDCGPLVYYPGSHKLPYVFSKEAGISEEDFRKEGYAPYHARYEPRIREMVAKMEPGYFHAKKGDVLIWHANLVHGGSARRNMALSRKSVVCHFYVKNAFVYHDLAAAQSKQQYMGTCLLRDERGKRRLF